MRRQITAALLLGGLSATSCRDAAAPHGGAVLWHVAGAGWSVRPTADAEHAYFGAKNHTIVAVDRATAAERWRRTTNASGEVTAGFDVLVVGPNVVFPDRDLFAYDRATGEPRWIFSPSSGDPTGNRLIASDGRTVFAGTNGGRVYAVDGTSGVQRWVAELADPARQDETVAFDPTYANGTVFVGIRRNGVPITGALVALDATTGSVLWKHDFIPEFAGQFSGCFGAAAVHGDDVIVASEDGRIFALRIADGSVLWTAPRVHRIPPDGPWNDLRELVVAGDIVVAASTTGIVIGLDADTGVERWREARDGGSVLQPFTTDGVSAFVSHGSTMIAYSVRSGDPLWTANAGRFWASPFVAGDTLFVSGPSGFFALRGH